MPTRQGWAALVMGLASITAGRVFGLLELYVVGAALVVALLLALVMVRRPLPAMHVRRTARPPMVSVGEPARVDLQVGNVSRRRSPRLDLWEPVGSKGGAPMQIAPLPAGDEVKASYRVPTTRRGVLQIGPLRATYSDPLGLCVRRTNLAGIGEVMVVPERVPLAFPTIGSTGRLGQQLRLKAYGQSGSEYHSQREYAPGDDLRRINWKTSARMDTLIVRETMHEGVQRCVVILDTLADSYTHADADADLNVNATSAVDRFELAITAAASIVAASAGGEIATRLVAPGIDLRGPHVAPESLRWLATVTPGDQVVDRTRTAHTNTDGIGVVVVISGSAATRACTAAAASTAPDEVLVMVCTNSPVAAGRSSRRGFVVDASSVENLRRNWDRLVSGSLGATR